MNVRIDKPIKKGEQRHGVLSREMNGVVCFDETNQWLNTRGAKSIRLKVFEKYGTRVTRKGDKVVLKQEVPVADFDVLDTLGRSEEMTDALLYISAYAERRQIKN